MVIIISFIFKFLSILVVVKIFCGLFMEFFGIRRMKVFGIDFLILLNMVKVLWVVFDKVDIMLILVFFWISLLVKFFRILVEYNWLILRVVDVVLL